MNVHPSDTPTDRLAALGNEMIEIHLWLREELARLRAGLDGTGPVDPPRVRDLRAHCLTFCAALEPAPHRRGRRRVPAAGRARSPRCVRSSPSWPATTRWWRGSCAGSRTWWPATPAPACAVELDGLAALLESHFRYEEKKLVTALNALTGRPGTAEALLGVTAPARQPG